MKIDKAIELNKQADTSLRTHKFSEHADAVALGTEALTYIIRLRACSLQHRQQHLPSEDPEDTPHLTRAQKLKILESPLARPPKE